MDLDPFRPEELCFTLLPKPDSQRGHRHNYYDGENGGLLIGPRSLKEMAFVQLSQRTWYLVAEQQLLFAANAMIISGKHCMADVHFWSEYSLFELIFSRPHAMLNYMLLLTSLC